MPVADIRTAMRSTIAAIPAVGVVTDYEPFAIREEDFKKYFLAKGAAVVLGWTITRESTESEENSQAGDQETHVMVVRGYHALQRAGASEQDFQTLIELVRGTMRAARSGLYGLGGALFRVEPPQLRLVDTRLFTDIYVHYCEIAQRCAEQVSLT